MKYIINEKDHKDRLVEELVIKSVQYRQKLCHTTLQKVSSFGLNTALYFAPIVSKK